MRINNSNRLHQLKICPLSCLFLLALCLGSAEILSSALAEKTPLQEKAVMTKIVFRNITPGIDKNSYESQPVTVYLYSDNFIRVQEQPDKLQGLHGLMIVRNTESWSINLLDNTANYYAVDEDLYDISIPLIPQTANDTRFEGLCYGKELVFFKDAAVSNQTVEGIPVQCYTMTRDGIQFDLLCKISPLRPHLLKISAGDQLLYHYVFEEYTGNLPVDMNLFELPPNIKIRNLPPHPADKSQKQMTHEDSVKQGVEFMTYYYQNPQPRKAGVMLKNLLNSSLFAQSDPNESHRWDASAYFFSRIAQLDPSILDDYVSLFKAGTHEQRYHILKILQVCGDQKVVDFLQTGLKQKTFEKEKEQIEYAIQKGIPIDFNPLARATREGSDLDFLWMEFMATGKDEPVLKVIESLKYYNDHNQNLLIVAHAAEWSLSSFCREHEKVLEICNQTIPKTEGVVNERLEWIVSEIEIERLPRRLPDNQMLRVVLRETTPGIAKHESKPKTYYRLGSTRWHVNKFSDSGSPMTIIVKEPGIWIISGSKSGIHFLGQAEYNYFFPMITPEDNEVNLHGLQLGTEVAFMKAKKAQRKSVADEQVDRVVYTLDMNKVHIELLCKLVNQGEIPWTLTVSEEKNIIFQCSYEQYELDLKPVLSLFEVPADVQIEEDAL